MGCGVEGGKGDMMMVCGFAMVFGALMLSRAFGSSGTKGGRSVQDALIGISRSSFFC